MSQIPAAEKTGLPKPPADKSTPRPWQIQSEANPLTIIGNLDGPDEGRFHYTTICEVEETRDGAEDANAALIVKAVNAHDAFMGMFDVVAGEADLWHITSPFMPGFRITELSRAEALRELPKALDYYMADARAYAETAKAAVNALPALEKAREALEEILIESIVPYDLRAKAEEALSLLSQSQGKRDNSDSTGRLTDDRSALPRRDGGE